MGPSKKMPPFDALLMTVFLAVALMATSHARPNDHNTQWNLRHSSQVAHPVLVNSSPVSDEFPIPRFAFPASASRRQDNPWPGNNLQDNVPLQVKPGDTVSLVVRGRNPLEPQPFVDVSSLLAELQKANVPTASDGAYHVFLAPPDFPPPPDGQKFDVTYVGQPSQSDQPQNTRQNNPHPPLFVAPLDYSVPAGYGRIQVPTRQVKFALPAIQQLQPNQQQQRPQQQPPQFQPPQPQFQPSFRPIESTPVQPQLSQQQFQAPPPQVFQQQPNPVVQQFRQPEPPVIQQFRQPEAPVVQQFRQPEAPVVQQFRQPEAPEIQQFRQPEAPAVQQFRQPESTSSFQPLQTAPQQPSLFDQALKELSITSVPVQALEEIPPPPPRKEPVVLAVERPAFLEPETPAAVTVPLPTTEAATTAPTTTAPATTAPTTTAPPTVAPKQRRPSSISAEGAQQPLFPDFQSVRQRQQINRQQGNRQQINRQKTTSSSSPSAFERRPSLSLDIPSGTGGEITFGQKIRSNKVKTNAQLSPPVVLITTTSAPLVADSSSLDADPPVVERDETFQTLESQNAASSRGRIRFSRPDQNQGAPSGNAIPSEAPTTAPSVTSGRGRIRITTTTAPPATTTNIPEVVTQPESITTTEKVFISTEVPEVEEEEEGEIEEESEVAQTTTTTPAPTTTTVAASTSTVAAAISSAPVRNNNNVNEKPWSPYEAIQRQRQTENKDKNKEDSGSNGSAQSGGPVRTRGKTTFATSSGSGRPSGSVPIRVERPVVLRPLAPASRTTATPTIRPSIVLSGGVRTPEDFVAPVAPEFGIRAGENGGKSSINPAPSQSLLPVGRRVPEIRPASAVGSSQATGGVVRLSRPVAVVGATTASPEPAAAEEEEEEEEEEEAAPEEADAEEEEEEEEKVEEQAEEVSSTTELPSTTEPAVVALPSTTTTEQPATTTQATETTEEEKTSGNSLEDPSSVLGVSTATEVSLMYELCYRGRCVRVHE